MELFLTPELLFSRIYQLCEMESKRGNASTASADRTVAVLDFKTGKSFILEGPQMIVTFIAYKK